MATRSEWQRTAIEHLEWEDVAMHARAAPEICSMTDRYGRLPAHWYAIL